MGRFVQVMKHAFASETASVSRRAYRVAESIVSVLGLRPGHRSIEGASASQQEHRHG